MNQYCYEFKDSAEYVFNWMNAQSSVGEESITDWLLFNLSQSLPSLKYKKFTRHEEARKTGADWEWWFVDGNSAISMRIQAKKLDSKKDNYEGLAHTNRYGLQIEKLINDARSNNFIPFYALYYAPVSNPQVLCGGNPDSGLNQGVFLATAPSLYDEYIKNGRKKAMAQDVISHSNPMHCMACCPKSGGTVSGIYSYIQSYFGDSLASINSNTQHLGLHEEPAGYVNALLRTEEAEIPDWLEEEFRYQLEDINALLVVDLSDSNEP